VELYYHDERLLKPEYLCTKCQKQAFHVWIKLMLLAITTDDKSKLRENIDDLRVKTEAMAKKNRITEDYWTKAITYEVNQILGKKNVPSE
jgi:hypothetical protein